MGKSQKKRSMRRHNPMRVPDSHLPKGLASASASSSKNEAILPIIQKVRTQASQLFPSTLIVALLRWRALILPNASGLAWPCRTSSRTILRQDGCYRAKISSAR